MSALAISVALLTGLPPGVPGEALRASQEKNMGFGTQKERL